MASITTEATGCKRILFICADGQRRSVRIGKTTRKQAEAMKTRIETILADQLVGRPHEAELLNWLKGLDIRVYERMARAGLVQPREKASVKLKPFTEEFFKAMVIKESTHITYAQTQRVLIQYFGADKYLKAIEPIDGDKWRQWMKEQGLAEATISRRVKCARQMFRRAMKWKLVDENPFAGVHVGSQSNRSRMYFVTAEEARKVLDGCPDAQWRLIFALSRYGGLRCPSEHLALKWSDVNWEHNRIRVPSKKTEHLKGGECRFIPIFAELRPFLMEVFEAAEPGTEHVITRYREWNSNPGVQLRRIVQRAGLKPWPKIFHNLRASRQTELAEKFPIHVVCAWLGNSQAIAQSHYLQVTDAHFTQAAQSQADKNKTQPAPPASPATPTSATEALTNAPVGEVAKVWATLPAAARNAVLAIVRSGEVGQTAKVSDGQVG